MSHEFESDISLKDLILKVQDYIITLVNSWKFIATSAILLAIVAFFLTFRNPPEYQADLTFMLNEDDRGGLTGFSGILGQFGLGVNSPESNLDKILQLSKSRRITQNVIFEKIHLNNKSDYIANHIITELESHDKWESSRFLFGTADSLSLEGFKFENDSIEIFSKIENKALKFIHKLIVGDDKSSGILRGSYNELTGIMQLSVNSSGEELSVVLVNKIFQNLSKYYIDKAIEKQKYDHDIIKSKHDSINNALLNVEYTLAVFEDSNKDIFRKKDLLKKNRLVAEKQKLQYMSGKAEEQLQLAQLSLENKTPYIQVIDEPLLPIKPLNKSGVFYFILGGILGGFLSSFFIVVKKLYHSIMQSNE